MEDAERHVAQRQSVGSTDPVRDVEVVDDQGVQTAGQSVGRQCRLGGHDESTCSSPSVTRFTPTMSEAMASAGKRVSHQNWMTT